MIMNNDLTHPPHNGSSNFADVVADTGSDVLIQASAGTGKTYNLTKRFIGILTNDRVPIDQILVMTFTDAAAAEMQDRIYKGILEAVNEAKDESLRSFLNDQKTRFGRNSIGTIHSFAGRVIRQSGSELSMIEELPVPASFDIPKLLLDAKTVSWPEKYTLIDGYAQTLLIAQWQKEFIKVHAEHERTVKLLSMVGTTSTYFEILDAVSKLHDDHLVSISAMNPSELLRLTKTYYDRLSDDLKAPWDRFLSNCKRYEQHLTDVIPDNAEEFLSQGWLTKSGISAKKVRKVTGEMDRVSLIETLTRYVKPLLGIRDLIVCYDSMVDAIQNGNSGADNPSGALDAAILSNMSLIAESGLRWKQFTRWKRASEGIMNFDDLIDLAHRLIVDFESVRNSLRSKYQHILVDEFQDTDQRQWEMINTLRGEAGDRRVFLVGDMKQAIYGFRGGNVSLIRTVEDESINGSSLHLCQASLKISRRSKPEIITFVNLLFEKALQPKHHERKFQANYMALDPNPDPDKEKPDALAPGSVRILHYEAIAEPTPDDTDYANKLKTFRFAKQGAVVMDAFQIASLLADIKADVDYVTYPEYRHIGDLMRQNKTAVGILVRTGANIDHLTTAFRLFGLRAIVRAGTGFFDRQEISDIYYLLRFLYDAWDDMALAAILRSPFFGMSDAGLLAIANVVRSSDRRTNWWNIITSGKSIPHLISPDRAVLDIAIKQLVNWRGEVRSKRIATIIEQAVTQTPFLVGQDDIAMARENAYKLIDLIRSLEDEGKAGLHEVTSWLSSQLEATFDSDATLPDTASIEITTMHRSKGLQYPMVILSNVGASVRSGTGLYISPIDTHDEQTPLLAWHNDDDLGGIIKSSTKSFLKEYLKRQIKDREDAEALRLFYVAVTRTESHLIISNPEALYTKKRPNPLLSSLHSVMIELEEHHSDWATIETIGEAQYSQLLNRIMSKIRGTHEESASVSLPEMAMTTDYEQRLARTKINITTPSSHLDGEIALTTEVEHQWNRITPEDAGTLVHLVLELPYLTNEYLFRRLQFELEGLEYDVDDVEISADIDRILQHAKRAKIAIDLRFPSIKTSYREYPIETFIQSDESTNKDIWVRGTIDLLIQDTSNQWHIIDFKTASLRDESVVSYAKEMNYDAQLQLYRRAVDTISGGNIQISADNALLLFTAMPECKWLSLSEMIRKM